jgi:4-amino-4-deoxy-L-arabinose transferase-like glycosyltransferase
MWVALGLVIVTGAALRIWGITFGLPHDSVRPDEEILVDAALHIFGGRLHPHFFDWPSLFLYTTAAGYAVVFAAERAFGAVASADVFIARAVANPTTAHLVARALGAACGVATIAALFGAARELCSRRTALIAAALVSVAFLHVRDSHYGLTDVPATFLVVCSFWAVARAASRGPTMARMAAAGVLAGLAASTKYNGALVLAPAVVVIVEQAVRTRDLTWGLKATAMLAITSIAGFVAGTPFAVLDYESFSAALSNVHDHLGGGHAGLDLGRGWRYHLIFTLRYGLGLPMLAMALGGAIWLVAQRSWRAAILLSFPVVYYYELGSGLTVFTRYMVPIVPFMCVTAAVFIDRVSDAAARVSSSSVVRSSVTAALVAAAVLPPLVQSIAFDRLLARPDTRLAGAAWVESHFPTGAALYQTGASYGHVQPHPKERYAEYTFDDVSGRFELDGRPAPIEPDIVIQSQSPLVAYSHEPAGLGRVLASDYVHVMTITAIPSDHPAESVYDVQDAFYVPYSGFDDIRRPGPNLIVFQRRPKD